MEVDYEVVILIIGYPYRELQPKKMGVLFPVFHQFLPRHFYFFQGMFNIFLCTLTRGKLSICLKYVYMTDSIPYSDTLIVSVNIGSIGKLIELHCYFCTFFLT